jgi:hypothetical protein
VKGKSKLKKKKKEVENEDLQTIIEEESLNEIELSQFRIGATENEL